MPSRAASRPMRASAAFLAVSLLALAIPLAAPTASAYCVSTICPPLCIVCIIVAQEVASAHCTATTDAAASTLACGSWLSGDKSVAQDLPVPADFGSYWVSVGPNEQVSYGYVLP